MKKTIFLLLAVVMACDGSFDFIEEQNAAPVVTIDGFEAGKKTIEERVKSGGNKGTKYVLSFSAKDGNKNIVGWSVRFDEKRVKVYRLQADIRSGGLYVFSDLDVLREQLDFEITGFGRNNVELKVRDSFGKEAKVVLALTVQENLPPVAVLKARDNDDGSYLLDGSDSYDGDEEFGGRVVGYEFTFLGKTLSTTKNSLPVVFEKGSHTVSLVVADDDGEKSEAVGQTVTVE